MLPNSAVPDESPLKFIDRHASRLVRSHRLLTGRDLLPPEIPDEELGAHLFGAPFVVVSHAVAADPVFNYGNQAALELFEMTWEEFTVLPSRLSAEPMHRDERARLLEMVARQGYIDDYRGIRISKTGRRFFIERATVWNVLEESGAVIGQAATFGQWTPVG
jgi:hypothetical protein